jgi:hypothetical protein
VTVDAPAYAKHAAAARVAATGGRPESDPAGDEAVAKRARALRHALAEYEIKAYTVEPERPLGELLA